MTQDLRTKREGKKRSFSRRVSRRFINGLILIVPIAITVMVIMWTLNLTEVVLGRHLPFYFPGMGIITVLLVIYLTGWLSSTWAMRKIIAHVEDLVDKIPVVKFIYNSVKHLSTAVFESNSMFNHVVLVPFHQSKALGFIMADVPEMLKEKLGDDYVCVFVPWSLNMTSGTNLFVKRSDVTYLDISSESALQYLLTAGAVMPQRSTEGAGLTVNPEALPDGKKSDGKTAAQGAPAGIDASTDASKGNRS